MTTSREDWALRVRELMQGRPVRWAGAPELVGDYDGRERTLEVFNANASEQRALLRSCGRFARSWRVASEVR